MASGGGPRAAGTDGADHKFRQRVDDHYKLMAAGRAHISKSASAHLAGALAFAAAAALSLSFESNSSNGEQGGVAEGASLGWLPAMAPTVLGAYLGYVGRGAAKMNEPTAATFAKLNAAMALILLGFAGFLALESRPSILLAIAVAGSLVSFIGCLYAARGTSTLRQGFAIQAEKKRGGR